MKQAYLETINDFEIELRNTPWWKFEYIRWLQNQIEHYEKKIEEENGKDD